MSTYIQVFYHGNLKPGYHASVPSYRATVKVDTFSNVHLALCYREQQRTIDNFFDNSDASCIQRITVTHTMRKNSILKLITTIECLLSPMFYL